MVRLYYSVDSTAVRVRCVAILLNETKSTLYYVERGISAVEPQTLNQERSGSNPCCCYLEVWAFWLIMSDNATRYSPHKCYATLNDTQS